jgi:hypothetical protein|tara:strand:+ start:333 stop:437 length:105 start_codon:yes stop_codon:yes gene_type:complete
MMRALFLQMSRRRKNSSEKEEEKHTKNAPLELCI